jgi:hypothetical protein
MKIAGYFTSIWEEGNIETPAILDLETGSLDVDFSEDCVEYEHLIREEFVSMGGEVYTVCPDCHSYITKNVLNSVDEEIVDVRVCKGNCNA